MDKRSEILQVEYQKRFEQNAEYRNMVWKILCKDFFSKYVKTTHVILDLGAGWGEFTKNILAYKKYAMDLNPDCGYRVDGFADFIQQDCSTLWPFPDGSLDVVFTSNFLEHLPNKMAIEATLDEANRCLKKGGMIICVGPNIRYLSGLYWNYWDHHIPITEESMAEVLHLHGFSVKENVARFLPYTMSGGSNPPPFIIKAYLRMPFLWSFFGKQFFIVGLK